MLLFMLKFTVPVQTVHSVSVVLIVLIIAIRLLANNINGDYNGCLALADNSE